MAKDFTLTLYQPPQDGTGPAIARFGDKTQKYEHTIRAQGGYWQNSWHIPLYSANDAKYLNEFFSTYLGYRVKEGSTVGTSWEGVIWSMELTLAGLTRTLELEQVYNAIRAISTDQENAQYDTADSQVLTIDERGFYSNAASIARYGRREFIFTMEGDMAEAEAAVMTQLNDSAFPRAIPTDADTDKEDGLYVQGAGWVTLLNNLYVSEGDGTDLNLSDYISEILTNDSEFVTAALITENTIQTKRILPDNYVRVWDKLNELSSIGDATGNPWVFYVGNNGRARYEPADTVYRYLWKGRQGLTDRLGKKLGWDAWPHVTRDMSGMYSGNLPSSFFLKDGRDMWLERIEMADDGKGPKPIPGGLSPDDLRRNVETHRRFLERVETQLERPA